MERSKFVPKRRWLFPMGCEREYQRFAKRLTNEIRTSVKEELDRLSSILHYSPLKQDGISEEVLYLMQMIRSRFHTKADQLRAEAELKKLASQTDDFNYTQFLQVMRSAVKVDIFQSEPWLKDLTDVWVAENVRLIASVPEQVFGDIEGVVRRGLSDGQPTNRMSEQILSRVDIGERRAQLIARDQIGKLNGDITKYRQTQAGIDEYIWSTSKDSRVRPEHAVREGKVFKWSEPPEDGHPGKAIYCRCVALPVIDLNKITYTAMPGRR